MRINSLRNTLSFRAGNFGKLVGDKRSARTKSVERECKFGLVTRSSVSVLLRQRLNFCTLMKL